MRRSFGSGCITPTQSGYVQSSLSPATLLRELSDEIGRINVPPLLSPCCVVNADNQQTADKLFHDNEEAPNLYTSKDDLIPWYENKLVVAIFLNLKQSEMNFPNINMESPDLSQRPFLVNYISHVSECLQLSNSSRYLAVRLLDGFMDKHSIMTYRLKLVALSCLHIAIKFEDVDYIFPSMKTLLKLGGQEEVELEDFQQMEIYILTFYEWRVSYPTHIHFIDFYLLDFTTRNDSDNTTLHQCAYSFLEFALTDNNFIQFKPSQVAAASVLAARTLLDQQPHWDNVIEGITGYSIEDLHPLSLIMQLHLEEIHSSLLLYKSPPNVE